MRSVSIAIAVFVFGAQALGQVEEGERRAEQYMIELTHGLREYYVEYEIHAESASKDAEMLFESVTTASELKTKDLEHAVKLCKPTIHDGVDTSTQEGREFMERRIGAFVKGDKETITVAGKKWVKNKAVGGPLLTGWKEGEWREENKWPFDWGGLEIPAKDWPLVYFHSLTIQSWNDMRGVLFKQYKCLEAKEVDGLLRTVREYRELIGEWRASVRPVITFKDDLVVRVEWVIHFSDGTPPMFMGEVRTEWNTSGPENYPERVKALLVTSNPVYGNLNVEVKYKWYFRGDKEFEAAVERAEKEAEPIPKREIAGAEAPAKSK